MGPKNEIPLMNHRILVTGFRPFLEHPINPSEVLVNSLNEDGLFKRVLPVEFNKAFEDMRKSIQTYKPDRILMLGLASGREQIHFEKIALNWNETEHPDEAGFTAEMASINKLDENLALMTRFPINELYQFHKKLNHPVKISFSAGTYVCNNLYYKVLSHFPEIKSLFIHIPSEQTLDLQTQLQIIKKTIEFTKIN
jgi:pyroglutamyl-peptidase